MCAVLPRSSLRVGSPVAPTGYHFSRNLSWPKKSCFGQPSFDVLLSVEMCVLANLMLPNTKRLSYFWSPPLQAHACQRLLPRCCVPDLQGHSLPFWIENASRLGLYHDRPRHYWASQSRRYVRHSFYHPSNVLISWWIVLFLSAIILVGKSIESEYLWPEFQYMFVCCKGQPMYQCCI